MRKKIIKAIFLLLFIVLAYYLVQGPLAGNLSKEALRTFIHSFGMLAPFVFILVYAIGICLFLPGTLLTAIGAILFGTFWGTILTLIGATIGASLAFFIARHLGKDFVDSAVKGKLKEYNKFIEKEGFSAIFYLRLIFVPFTPLNFAAGLTKVKFKDYFWGTLLGIIPGAFIFNFFFDSITDITSTSNMLSWKVILSVVLFVVSFFIPVIIRKRKNKFLKK